jgi:hypothetical protein
MPVDVRTSSLEFQESQKVVLIYAGSNFVWKIPIRLSYNKLAVGD